MSIEKAAEAIVEKSHEHCATWITIEEARELARAALPHLMKEPTSAEISRLISYVHCDTLSAGDALCDFVRRRNAPPEPPDSTIEKVSKILKEVAGASVRPEALASKIVRIVREEDNPVMAVPPEPPKDDPAVEMVAKLLHNPPHMIACKMDVVALIVKTVLSALDSLKETR